MNSAVILVHNDPYGCTTHLEESDSHGLVWRVFKDHKDFLAHDEDWCADLVSLEQCSWIYVLNRAATNDYFNSRLVTDY